MTDPQSAELMIADCVDLECLNRIHDALDSWWSAKRDVSVVDRMMFELAIIEVAGNILAHRSESEAFTCSLRVTITSSTLGAEFRDSGAPVQVDLSALTLPGADAEGGRGLPLVRAAVDDLSYERIEGENRWRMSRHRRDP
ncbi:ATP-binding protein [Nakamurella sp. GG22]